ncbi:hypothetical protein BDV26DRAFT_264667 [Aspergillus bertholletiae]|uniref:Uncharacterized protein n=1 Tax=Aspergillus bertholletiae TaxID=1226010 RepID=A0A5N7B4Q0_9EURO|nr:hypothetical protein BDV26DRAFT_264667 [Aspergillus bertholletiae]
MVGTLGRGSLITDTFQKERTRFPSQPLHPLIGLSCLSPASIHHLPQTSRFQAAALLNLSLRH